MATYTSNAAASTVQARSSLYVDCAVVVFTVSTALVTSDVITGVKIPNGATIIDVSLLGSGSIGATASLSVGDATVNARYITATSYAAAAFTRMNSTVGLGFQYSADSTINIYAVSMATGTTGQTLTLSVLYSMNQRY